MSDAETSSRQEHYQKLKPLVEKARTILGEVLESEDEKLKFQAARYVLDHSGGWIREAEMSEEEKEKERLQKKFEGKFDEIDSP